MTERECAPADDLLAKRYQAIVASSGGLPNHLQDKSALFRRLKAGLKALVIPPPCSFSYPWYEVVESDTRIELTDEPSAWPEAKGDGLPPMLINQTLWVQLPPAGDGSLRVTSGGWDKLGFAWKVWRERVPAKQSGAALCCRHDPQIKKIETELQLRNEAAWRVDRDIDELRAICTISSEDERHEFFCRAVGGERKDDRIIQFMAKNQQERAEARLKKRRESHLPDLPTAEERQLEIEREMTLLLGDTWELSEGLLVTDSWWIQRITPAKLTAEHYLDI